MRVDIQRVRENKRNHSNQMAAKTKKKEKEIKPYIHHFHVNKI